MVTFVEHKSYRIKKKGATEPKKTTAKRSVEKKKQVVQKHREKKEENKQEDVKRIPSQKVNGLI